MTRKDVDPISQVTVFQAQWTDTPDDVYEEVRELWKLNMLGNDCYYYSWNSEEDQERWPVIDSFLKSRGVYSCLINWWW